VLKALYSREHADQGQLVDPSPEHALHCNLVNDVVIARLGIVGANDGHLLELVYLIEGQAQWQYATDTTRPRTLLMQDHTQQATPIK